MKKLSKSQINIITDSIIYHSINDADTVMLDETDLSIDIKDEIISTLRNKAKRYITKYIDFCNVNDLIKEIRNV